MAAVLDLVLEADDRGDKQSAVSSCGGRSARTWCTVCYWRKKVQHMVCSWKKVQRVAGVLLWSRVQLWSRTAEVVHGACWCTSEEEAAADRCPG